jgi:DNA (cytosine-5)-methyltransferase 1
MVVCAVEGAMRAISLFSGVGGMDLGFERAGIETVLQVEIDEFCRQVLAKHWPCVRRLADIHDVRAEDVRGADVVFGGFPCQPVSHAGKRKAQADERWLWPEFERVVRMARPRYVVVENVPGLLTAGMGDVLAGLSSLGFDAEWSVVSACSVGAPHTRERVFIIAYPAGERRPEVVRGDERFSVPPHPGWAAGHAYSRTDTGAWLAGAGLSESGLLGSRDGLPRIVDRLRSLGNAVVPQVAELIGRRLVTFDRALTGAVR